jgi:VWFA-related protein
MSIRRLRNHFSPLAVFFLFLSVAALAQTRTGGGGGGSRPSQPTQGRLDPTTPRSVPANSVSYRSANDEGKLEFRTQTILVQVPVVVTDKSGSHIHGLTKDDFRLTENGKEQSVSTFEEMVATTGKLPAPTLKPGQFANLTLSEDKPRTVTVIALDTVNTPFLDQTYGRRELVKYLSRSLDSGQVLALMIITSHGLQVVQSLTGDPEQLQQILKKTSGELPAMDGLDVDAQADAAAGDIPDVPGASLSADPEATMQAFIERGDAIVSQYQQQNAIETTMNAFLGIAWSLSGVPGRKSLIWATGGFPFTLRGPDAVPNGYLSTLYERTMAALSEAQISVYPVDVRGLVTANPIGEASRSGVPTARQINNRAWLQQSSIDSLNEFADMTGGKAFYNTNDLAASFKRAADDASSYYLLGYYLDVHNDHAGWRQLKVKVDKKDTEVRARKGIFVTNATVHAQLSKNSDMNYALTTPVEGTGVPITVEWAGVVGEGEKKKVVFTARMPPNGLTIDPATQNKIDFEFATLAWKDKDSKPASSTAQNFSKVLPDAQLASIRANGVSFKNSIELAPGKYTVRFVVRDNFTGKVGSVTAPLTVN